MRPSPYSFNLEVLMKHNKGFTELILKIAEVTRGRISRREVFRDFVAYCALRISILTDPVHTERIEHLDKLIERYVTSEREAFEQAFHHFIRAVLRNIECCTFEDLLSTPFFECSAANRSLKQDFTPPDIAKLLALLIYGDPPALPQEGYYTLNDPTCGSGSLLLASVDCLARRGVNPSEQLVIQASDLDITCVQMTYIQLSLYGVPAVVIRGDVLTLKEYDRWYTPAYLLGKWIWRAPQPFGARKNESDERLKMLEEPMYAAFRLAEQFMRGGEER